MAYLQALRRTNTCKCEDFHTQIHKFLSKCVCVYTYSCIDQHICHKYVRDKCLPACTPISMPSLKVVCTHIIASLIALQIYCTITSQINFAYILCRLLLIPSSALHSLLYFLLSQINNIWLLFFFSLNSFFFLYDFLLFLLRYEFTFSQSLPVAGILSAIRSATSLPCPLELICSFVER